jgi:hypothetical protein
MGSPLGITVVASSSAVPQVALATGIAHLLVSGMIVNVQPIFAAQDIFDHFERRRAKIIQAKQ